MGIKKVFAMLKEFKYLKYEVGDYIIKEGELGLTFYVIISGNY